MQIYIVVQEYTCPFLYRVTGWFSSRIVLQLQAAA